MKEFDRFVEVMRKLRAPDGCPWDRAQTLATLKPQLLEEVYELIDSMDKGGEELEGELGDIFLHIIFQCLIKEEENEFTIEDVLIRVTKKLIRRHPHVFGETKVENEIEVKKMWDKIKSLEKGHEHRESKLDRIPNSLPPIIKAKALQNEASKCGFEWESLEGVFSKVEEEIQELKIAKKNKKIKDIEEEFGDLLFSIINTSKFLGVDPVNALIKTNKKFEKRFRYIEKNCIIEKATLEEMDKLWEESKLKK